MIFEETLFDKYYKKYNTTKKGYCYTHLNPYKVTRERLHDLVDLFYKDTVKVLKTYFNKYIVEEILGKIGNKYCGVLALKTGNLCLGDDFNEIDKLIKGVLKIVCETLNVIRR